MPVPGSLRKMPVDEDQIAELLLRQFNLPREETKGLVASMIERGLIIEATGTPKRYAPLHPRMTLTNIFKIYEKDLVQSLRDRRATVDRVVNLLIPIYEERKPHNSRTKG